MTEAEVSTLAGVLHDHRPAPDRPANILRTLLAVQQAIGHVPPDSLRSIAEALGVTEADIAGVVSYYPDLHTTRRGRRVVRVCLGEACVANHADRVLAEVRRMCGIGLNQTTPDGQLTLERVYCLGNCAVGPTVMVDDRLYGRMTGTELCALLSVQRAESGQRSVR